MTSTAKASGSSPLRERISSPTNSPSSDPAKQAILASSTSGWSPLRISKRDETPSRIQPPSTRRPLQTGPVRRTSSSFNHVRNHSLVSNSPFKAGSPPLSVSTSASRLSSPRSRIPTSRRVSGERKISLERKKKPMFNGSSPGAENTRPIATTPLLRGRQSNGIQRLAKAEYVTNSPFLSSTSLSSSTSSSSSTENERKHAPPPKPEPESTRIASPALASAPAPAPSTPTRRALPQPSRVAALSSSRPTTPSPTPSPQSSPSPRSNLVSKRFHGPRTPSRSPASSTGTRRGRRKTVTFDERCDVLEFDIDEFDESVDVFESDDEVNYDPNRQYASDGQESLDDSRDEIDLDGDVTSSDINDSILSDRAAVDNLVGSILNEDFGTPDHLDVDFSMGTPPPSFQTLSAMDGEDGVPFGRSHHAERHHAHGLLFQSTPPRTQPIEDDIDQTPPSPSPVTSRSLPTPPGTSPPISSSTPFPSSNIEIAGRPSSLRSTPEQSPPVFSTPIPASQTGPEMGYRSGPLGRGLEPSDSLSSLTSSGSINGRSSPRINREEVKRRLMKTRTSPIAREEPVVVVMEEPKITTPPPNTFIIHPDEDLELPPSPVLQPLDRALPPLPSTDDTPPQESAVPDALPTFSSESRPHFLPSMESTGGLGLTGFDIGTPGMDLGEVRSALDRLMLGVERGFVDESTVQDNTFLSEEGDLSSDSFDVDRARFSTATDMSLGEVMSGERAVFVTAQEKRPSVCPPSPLVPVHTGSDTPPTSASASASDRTTGTETEEEGPQTPSNRSVSPPRTALSDDDPFSSTPTVTPKEHRASKLSPFNKPLPPIDIKPAPPPEPVMSGKDIIKAHEAAIIAKRRERRQRERSGSFESLKREEQPQRRRSRSTGDALDTRGERVAAARSRADHDLLGASLSGTPTTDIPLSDSIEQELNKMMHGKEDRKYHVREHTETIYASAEKVSHLGNAGDIDGGKAWRTVRRPSDMNEYSRQIKEYRAQEKPGKAHGKVFVKVLGIKSVNVPIPRLPTFYTCTLNNGIHFVTTPECRLLRDSPIDQEFELIEHSKLEFTLTLKVRKDAHIQAQVKRAVTPPPPPPAPAPVKSSGMRAFFGGSPKKEKVRSISRPPPPPEVVEDNLAKYLRADGTLARSFISFKDIAKRCDTRVFETSFPLIGQTNDGKAVKAAGTSTRTVGEIILQIFRLPPLPGVAPDDLPQSLEECQRGLRHIAWHKVTYHQGVLTQNGGDCNSWRRRQLRLIGANLVAFNDVTKKPTATIELRKAIAVEDDNEPPAPGTISRKRRPRDDATFKVERSFRLVFPDDEEISFFADNDEDKAKWLEVLRALIGRIPPHPLWAELIWERQNELASTTPSAPTRTR